MPHLLFWAALAVLEVAVLYQNGKGKTTTFFIQNFSQIYRIIAFICLLYSENYNERCLISNSSIFRMAAINLTPGHKYILCTEHSLYMQPPTTWVGAAGAWCVRWGTGSHSGWQGPGVTVRTSMLGRLQVCLTATSLHVLLWDESLKYGYGSGCLSCQCWGLADKRQAVYVSDHHTRQFHVVRLHIAHVGLGTFVACGFKLLVKCSLT